ncbi:hypothetical protein [Christensenella intestinihominis]|jgi:hypothetical protein|uniref:hypothetical protein n=1 Tax=Christensenella intestinihominis TaxID=1851429 RepID=UPI0008303D2A|nr:hypothetical protein [Christensenella intestinihominis]
MKKQITLFTAVLLCIVLIMGCGTSLGSEIHISFSGAPEIHERQFVSDSETIGFHGTISVIGGVGLKILSADGGELYCENFQDVRGREFSVEVTGLTPGGEYTLVLDGSAAISCTLDLSTNQKLIADVPAPAVTRPEK